MAELEYYKIDNNEGIIVVSGIPQQPPHAPLVVNNTEDNNIVGSDDDDNEDTESNNNNGSNNDDDAERGNNKPADLAAATDPDGNKLYGNQGVQRLQHRGKGIIKKYINYSLLMTARQERRGGPHRALIWDGCVFFLADDLSHVKPIPKEDREELALGVALLHYVMNAGIKKFKAKGEADVTKELTQMNSMSVFRPIEAESLTYDERKKPSCCSCSSKSRGTVE